MPIAPCSVVGRSSSSGHRSRANFDSDHTAPAISGISMRLSREYLAVSIGFGAQVNQHGVVLDEIIQPKRYKRAAKRLMRSLIKRLGFIPKRIITDKLRSYGAAKTEIAPGLDHWLHKGLNNRAENSHLPFRKQERTMQGHRSPGALQRFVATHSAIRRRFSVPARRHSALTIRYHRLEVFDAWNAAAKAALNPKTQDLCVDHGLT